MNKIFVLGDIHGKYQPIRDFYERNKDTENFDGSDVIILLGDAGINYFGNYRDDNTKNALCKYPFTYFIIRGNHEQRPSILAEQEPSKWTTEQFWGNDVWVEKRCPQIKYAMDYAALYDIPNKESSFRTLVLPGAYSVDKLYRLQMGYSWFPQEQMSKEERTETFALLKECDRMFWNIDIILSHTCPICFEPTDLFLPMVDQSGVDKTMERFLGQVEYQCDYKAFLWGHFHQFREYPRQIGVPSSDNPRCLMLYNDYAVELEDVMTNKNLVNRL